MRILVGVAVGFVIGLICLVGVYGAAHPMIDQAFTSLHAPAIYLAQRLIRGESVLMVIPFTIVLQWVLTGGVVGLVFHLRHRSKIARSVTNSASSGSATGNVEG